MIVVDRAQHVADWVAAQSGVGAPTVDAAIGYEVDGQLRAGVYFDCLTGSNVFAHIAASTMTLPPDLLIAVAQYAFRQLGLRRMTFAVAADNTRTIDFVRGMGAPMEALLRHAAGQSDLLLFVLWADSPFPQRLLTRGTRHGKQEDSTA